MQAAEKFKAPQPAPVIPEAKAAAIEQEEESEEEEVKLHALLVRVMFQAFRKIDVYAWAEHWKILQTAKEKVTSFYSF